MIPAFDRPPIHLPFASRINPHLGPASRASDAWLESMGLIDPATRQVLDSGRFGELNARVFPDVDAIGLEHMISLMSWLFLLDDALDQGELNHHVIATEALLERLFSQLAQDPLAPAAKPGLELAGCALIGSIRRGLSTAGQRRFLGEIRAYFDAVLKEVEIRAAGEVPDLLAFALVRRYTGASQLMFSAGEYANHAELPEAFCRTRPFQALQQSTSDVLVLVNDIFSYAKESRFGEINNYVVVCRHHLGLSVREAMAFVNGLVTSRVRTFEQARERLPAFLDQQRYTDLERQAIERYADALESWMSGNLDWSLEVPRYNAPCFTEEARR
ncbi:terpene synthase family protein [Pseudomonas gingeri]